MTIRTPMPMASETSPMNRSCPSESSVSRRNASRQARGATSGSSPASTSTRPHAARNESGTARLALDESLLGTRPRRALGFARLLQIPEELGVRVEDQHVSLAPERRLVRLEAAIEGIKLGVLPVRGSIDRRGPCVTLAFDLLRLLERIRKNDLALAIGVRADLLRFGCAL